jgi:hypothetical protein
MPELALEALILDEAVRTPPYVSGSSRAVAAAGVATLSRCKTGSRARGSIRTARRCSFRFDASSG